MCAQVSAVRRMSARFRQAAGCQPGHPAWPSSPAAVQPGPCNLTHLRSCRPPTPPHTCRHPGSSGCPTPSGGPPGTPPQTRRRSRTAPRRSCRGAVGGSRRAAGSTSASGWRTAVAAGVMYASAVAGTMQSVLSPRPACRPACANPAPHPWALSSFHSPSYLSPRTKVILPVPSRRSYRHCPSYRSPLAHVCTPRPCRSVHSISPCGGGGRGGRVGSRKRAAEVGEAGRVEGRRRAPGLPAARTE